MLKVETLFNREIITKQFILFNVLSNFGINENFTIFLKSFIIICFNIKRYKNFVKVSDVAHGPLFPCRALPFAAIFL